MGEVYARSVSGQGYAAQVQAIIAANPHPSPLRGTVPPAAQVVLDQLPPGMPWHNIEATLRAAAPSGPTGVRPSLPATAAGQALLPTTAGNSDTADGSPL
jgi:hypothetical protein